MKKSTPEQRLDTVADIVDAAQSGAAKARQQLHEIGADWHRVLDEPDVDHLEAAADTLSRAVAETAGIIRRARAQLNVLAVEEELARAREDLRRAAAGEPPAARTYGGMKVPPWEG